MRMHYRRRAAVSRHFHPAIAAISGKVAPFEQAGSALAAIIRASEPVIAAKASELSQLNQHARRTIMSVAKHVEISASSTASFEDAIRQGIKKTAESVKGIQGAWVKEQKLVVDGDDITEFRVTMKVTFIVK